MPLYLNGKKVSPVITTEGSGNYETYTGSYSVRSLANQTQTLYTNGKVMNNNITIQAVGYYETSNAAGGKTIYIGE